VEHKIHGKPGRAHSDGKIYWKRGEVALLSPEGSHKRSFRILGEQGSGRLAKALGPSNPEHPAPSPSPQPQKELLLRVGSTRPVQPRAPSPQPQPPAPAPSPSPEPQKELLLLQPLSAEETVVIQQHSRTVISYITVSHFATLPTHVAPSLCAHPQTVVSLGPPEGATTHFIFYCICYLNLS